MSARTRYLGRHAHPFAPSGRVYDGAVLCAYCNTPESADVHAAAAIAAMRLRRAGHQITRPAPTPAGGTP